jgi:hypothetical protein
MNLLVNTVWKYELNTIKLKKIKKTNKINFICHPYFAGLSKMQQAGMSTGQNLQSSTINGAKALGKENEFGSITVDKKTNMVLLNENPLDSLANWRKIFLIINKGEIVKPGELINKTVLQ